MELLPAERGGNSREIIPINAVIVAAYVFMHCTNGGGTTTVTGLYSLGQFTMAGKVVLTWPGGWGILRIRDVRAGNAWKEPREE